MVDIGKNNRIRDKGREGRTGRRNQDARLFKIKLDRSKTSKQKLDDLKRLFLEGKRFTRTTGVCTNYGISQQLDLSDRTFTYPSCNSIFDGDVTAANKMMKEGLSLRNIVETLTEDDSVSMLGYLKGIPHVKASMAVEARSPKSTDGWGYRSLIR